MSMNQLLISKFGAPREEESARQFGAIPFLNRSGRKDLDLAQSLFS
jgi:hypothetical protein